MNKLYAFVILIIVIVVSAYVIYTEGSLPVNKNSKENKIFIVKPGEGLNSIAKELSNANLIRNRIVFFLVVKQMGIEKNIQAGDFRLSPSMDVFQIAKNLTHGTLDIWTTIIEGLRKEEVAQIIAKNFSIPETEFIKSAEEGFLFPDTYLFPRQATAGSIVSIMSNTFRKKYSQELQINTQRLKLTELQVVTLASLVEREAQFDQDRQEVASILLKRYLNDWPLQIDATVQYAIGYNANEKTWWKKNLSKDDLAIDSPYNTYKNKGIPPGPICNPSLSSIIAVVNANAQTPYWYYSSDKTGHMHFAKTLEEHEANVSRYLK